MTDLVNQRFDEEIKKENRRLIRKALLAVDRTVKNFITNRGLIENRGVSIEEFNKIKSINKNTLAFETSYAAYDGSNYHDDGIYWIGFQFVDKPALINFQIGLKAIEFIEEPAYNHVEILLRFDEWVEPINLTDDRKLIFRSGYRQSLTFHLPLRQVTEKFDIVDLLSDSFLFAVDGNYFAEKPAEFARVSRDFRLKFSKLNCNEWFNAMKQSVIRQA